MEKDNNTLSPRRLTFKKRQRLCRKKWIEALFSQGERYFCYPIKCYCLPHPEATIHQMLVAISRKVVPKAVQRNKIRRQIRNVHRLLQPTWPAGPPHWLIAYIYVGHQSQPSYDALHNAVAHLRRQLFRIASRG